MENIRVLIADKQVTFRRGLRTLIHPEDGIEFVGEASNGDEAILLADSMLPDVILMDVKLPGIKVPEAVRRILSRHPHMRILMLTLFEMEDAFFSALGAGALGYLVRGAVKTEILRAVRCVSNGEAIFSPPIARRLIHHLSRSECDESNSAFPELTERERQILDLVAQHMTNIEIARHLSISPKTIRNHVSNILNKLQVTDRAQAIIRAREAGLGRKA